MERTVTRKTSLPLVILEKEASTQSQNCTLQTKNKDVEKLTAAVVLDSPNLSL